MQSGRQSAQVGRQPTSARGKADRKIRSRPISRVLSCAVIHLGHASPHASCDLPEDCAGRTSSSYLVLLRMGFTVPRTVAGRAVRSYRTLSPLPDPYIRVLGGLLSVALSVGSRPPGVTWHPALWSPDFPPCPQASTATAWPTPSAGVYHPAAMNGGSTRMPALESLGVEFECAGVGLVFCDPGQTGRDLCRRFRTRDRQ